jgi:hypothetical protein
MGVAYPQASRLLKTRKNVFKNIKAKKSQGWAVESIGSGVENLGSDEL